MRPLVQNDNDRSSQRVSVGVVCEIVDIAVLRRLLAVIAGKFALGEGRLSICHRGIAVGDEGGIVFADESHLGVHRDPAIVLLDFEVEVLVVEEIVINNVALLRNLEGFNTEFT